jgi:uncharacterized protein (DUF1810 family)
MPDLDRFIDVQNGVTSGLAIALAELKAGEKRSHWIWYVFPQLAGLGRSPMAVRYGLGGISEATAYLQHPVLRARLREATDAVREQLTQQPSLTLDTLMGSEIDATKLVSSMTLFSEIARRLAATEGAPDYAALASSADSVLVIAAKQGYAPCATTLAALSATR